ncbi:urease accessory protein UreD [Tengunoibacter tsumagoiensis]|uniref:Urease accessory protein UreD n=1 Tax=Tengunoibacter tsumagoiensis TaxID=2014871 RepID=A0A402A3I8_9CHLR|nr:urease accessory protein UreD [Tengunoibacter tsumagoiensis]GCE13606.1 urease accessory protein UreD [Tengunoibacter tsumagoiensis]
MKQTITTIPALAEASQPQVLGRLVLSFRQEPDTQRTQLIRTEQQPPLKVVRAFPLPLGGVLLHLHNLSGGVLGGDLLELSLEVQPRADVQVTTTSATRIYRSRPAMPPAIQRTQIVVREGGRLEYLPDMLIPFAGSRYQQYTTIQLEQNAGLFWWEIIAPGRTAHGELFAYEELTNHFTISALNRPIASEHFQLQPARQRMGSSARLGPYTYSCSFYLCRVGLEPQRWLALERSLGRLAQELSQPAESLWGVSTLVSHGLVVRGLSNKGRDLAPGLLRFWQEAKLELYGEEAILPRKVY